MIFAIHLLDHAGTSESTRAKNRPEHLAYLQLRSDRIAFAGPLRDTAGVIIGSLLVIDFEDRDEALAWLSAEPFHRAGLYAVISVHEFENRWPQRVGYAVG